MVGALLALVTTWLVHLRQVHPLRTAPTKQSEDLHLIGALSTWLVHLRQVHPLSASPAKGYGSRHSLLSST